MVPSRQRAAIVSESHGGVTFGLAEVPKPGPGQILVRVKVISRCTGSSAEPYKFRLLDVYSEANCKYGGIKVMHDYLTPGLLRNSDRMFLRLRTSNFNLQVVSISICWSFEEAAQLGSVAPLTTLQSLHESLELPSPFEARFITIPQRTLLIWRGASAVGQYAIQFAKLGGLRVLTRVSSKNFDLVKGGGADEIFDYRGEGVVEKIRAATGDALNIAIDTISEDKTLEMVTGAIGDKVGDWREVAIINPYESPRRTVKVTFSMLTELLRRVRLIKRQVVHRSTQKILATGNVKPVPVFIQPNGIARVKDGLQYMQNGKVSAQKLTCRVPPTV